MTTIGQLTEYQYNNERCFTGYISTLDIDVQLRLKPTGNTSPDAPAYEVFALGNKQQEIKIGAAWLKQPNKPDSKISEFLSLTLDDPSFPHPLNVAAFPKEKGEWEISWRRRQAAA
jgi:uncharacterized protein (DUF736 family)